VLHNLGACHDPSGRALTRLGASACATRPRATSELAFAELAKEAEGSVRRADLGNIFAAWPAGLAASVMEAQSDVAVVQRQAHHRPNGARRAQCDPTRNAHVVESVRLPISVAQTIGNRPRLPAGNGSP